MKQLKTVLTFLLLTTLVFSGCKKDDDESPSNNAEVLVNGSISGLITDQFNVPVPEVLVNMSTNTTTTDENGYFNFKNVEISSNGSLITTQKDGYFNNAKFVRSKLNKQNFSNFMLTKKFIASTYSAVDGATVNFNGGASVQLPANGIKDANGDNYTGDVKVYATWLDPTAPNLAQLMPGDLRASNIANEQVQLTTYGMIGVELEGENGQALNLADGQSATIEVNIPATLLANAPATIPLWHFDESSGLWMEEGQATLQGDKYVGTVSHFSFWNYDVPSNYIFIEGLVTGKGGIGVENLTVVITNSSNATSGTGLTDQDGIFQGAVPNDVPLTISVLDNCNNVIYTAEIGPFSTDSSIPEISIDNTNSTISINGTLVDCDNNSVSNGYVHVEYGEGSSILQIDANGVFNNTISICDASEVTLTGFDFDNFTESTEQSFNLTTSTVEVGNIQACTDLTEYFNYTIDGFSFSLPDPMATYVGTTTFEISGFISNDFNVSFIGDDSNSNPGLLNMHLVYMVALNDNFLYPLNCAGTLDCNTVDFDISPVGEIGAFIIGTMEGTLISLQDSLSYEVNAEFKVLIE